MTPGEVAARAAFACAAWSAWRLARPERAPSHRPIARALALALLCDIARAVLLAAGAPRPFRRALFLAFPALSLWCSAAALAAGRPRGVRLAGGVALAVWCALAGGVALVDPPRESFEQLAHVVHLVVVLVELLVVALLVVERRIPTITETVAMLLVAGDVAALAGPWRHPVVWQVWELARWQWAVVYSAITCVQVGRIRWTTGRSNARERGCSRWGRRSRALRSCSSGARG